MKQPERILLARNGRSAYRIVIAAAASEPERFAARELRRYIRRVTGADLPLTAQPAGAGRTLTVAALHDGAGVPRDLASVRAAAGAGADAWRAQARRLLECREESFGISVRPDGGVLILGRDPGGALNGAYAFLERFLGVSWPDMDPGGEVVPRRATVALPVGARVEEPAFAWRGLGDGCSLEYSVRDIDWLRKRRLNVVIAGLPPYWDKVRARQLPEIRRRAMRVYVGGHIAHNYFPDPAVYFKRHPDYYALVAGQRVPGQICYSNPEACAIHRRNLVDYVRQHPEIDIFAAWGNDGKQYCQCDACRKAGTGRLLFDFYSRLADDVARVCPRTRIEHGNYLDLMLPIPKHAKPHPNLVLLFAPYDNSNRGERLFDRRAAHPMRPDCTNRKACRDLDALLRVTPNVLVFSYFTDQTMKGSCYTPAPEIIRDDMRYYRAVGVAGFHDCQVKRHLWWLDSLNIHVHARMLWDPDQPLDPVLREYYGGLYGPAADEVAGFDRAVERLAATVLPHGFRAGSLMGLTFGVGGFMDIQGKDYRPAFDALMRGAVRERIEAAAAWLDRADAAAATASNGGAVRRRLRRLRLCLGQWEDRLRLGHETVRVAWALARCAEVPAAEHPACRRELRRAYAAAKRVCGALRQSSRRFSVLTRSPRADLNRGCRRLEAQMKARVTDALNG